MVNMIIHGNLKLNKKDKENEKRKPNWEEPKKKKERKKKTTISRVFIWSWDKVLGLSSNF